MITAFIGPNGYGKSTKLEEIYDLLVKEDKYTYFLPSEILLDEEIKDTKDNTKTMEYFLTTIINNDDDLNKIRSEFSGKVDELVLGMKDIINEKMDEALLINDSKRSKDIINTTKTKEFKKLIKIDSKDYKGLMGSGQKVQFLLSLISEYPSNNIIIDEPEKYSHPSLLNKTAKLINELSKAGKDVYISTHSPKLLSLLDIEFKNILIINKKGEEPRCIDFKEPVNKLLKPLMIENMDSKNKKYYNVGTIEKTIKSSNHKEFLECLFAKKVYICEGLNDSLFINWILTQEKALEGDHVIFKTFGKWIIPLYIELFKSLNIDVVSYYDSDVNKDSDINKKINSYLDAEGSIELCPNLESVLSYKGAKYDLYEFNEHLNSLDYKEIYKKVFKDIPVK